MRRCLSGLLLLALAAGALPAQGVCEKCKGTGLVPCKGRAHESKKICGTETPHRCDVILRAPCCRGFLQVPCEKCKNTEALAAFEKEMEERRAWVVALAPLDRVAGTRLVHVETAHFLVHFSVPGWKTKSKRYNRVKAAHLFADRLEEAAKLFEEAAGLLPEKRQTMFILATSGENRKVSGKELGKETELAMKIFGAAGKATQWPSPPHLVTDEAFHGHVVHNAAHLLAHAVVPKARELPWWLDLGLAHWIEHRTIEKVFTYCLVTDHQKSEWDVEDWRQLISSEVRGRENETLRNLAGRSPEGMKHRDHAYGWAFVDYIISEHPGALRKLLEACVESTDTDTILERALEMDSDAFQEAWVKHLRKPSGRRR